MTAVSAQQKPRTGYAPVNGVKMYYEVHGGGEPVVLLHGAFMTITNNWPGGSRALQNTESHCRRNASHGRTATSTRDHLRKPRDDVAALLNHLKVARADLIGYSMAAPWRCRRRSAIRTKCEGQ